MATTRTVERFEKATRNLMNLHQKVQSTLSDSVVKQNNIGLEIIKLQQSMVAIINAPTSSDAKVNLQAATTKFLALKKEWEEACVIINGLAASHKEFTIEHQSLMQELSETLRSASDVEKLGLKEASAATAGLAKKILTMLKNANEVLNGQTKCKASFDAWIEQYKAPIKAFLTNVPNTNNSPANNNSYSNAFNMTLLAGNLPTTPVVKPTVSAPKI